MKNVLLITKDLASRGGVANYYRLFLQEFKSNDIKFRVFVIGSRAKDYGIRNERKASYLINYFLDITRLVTIFLNDKSIRIVQVSPSLLPIPLIRDGCVILISKIFRKQVVVFFRGWRDKSVIYLRRKSLIRFLFRLTFQRADANIFLAARFANDLEKSGVKLKNIHITRTFFLRDQLENLKTPKKNGLPKFIFISRISQQKGTTEILKASKELSNSNYEFLIEFYGHFADTKFKSEFFDLISDLHIGQLVKINPYITEHEKFSKFKESDIFLLPSYEEGCPNSVIEAMASGCYIISSNVGALPEIVQDGVNGLIMEEITVENLVAKMAFAIENIALIREKGANNIKYAYDNFEARSHIRNMGILYKSLL